MNRTTAIAALIAASLPLTTGTLTPASGAEEAAARATSYKVTASINKTRVVAKEDTVVIRGRVTPRAVGQKVVLQQRLEGKKRWANSGTTRIKPTGRYKITDDPTTAGTRSYRVLKPTFEGIKAGISEEMRVDVYAWDRLAYRMPGANLNLRTGTVYVGTEAFTGSLSTVTAGSPGYVEYTLGGKCTQLRSTYALTDSSATNSTGAVNVLVDGALRVQQALAVGPGKEVVTDIRDAFRVRFEFSSTGQPAGYPTAASAEVLCTK